MAAVAATMDTILMEMSKMWKVSDGHTDEGRTMVNRPRHKLTWSKVPGELTVDLQDGCCGGYCGYRNKMFLTILNLHVTPMSPTSFGSIWHTIREQMRFDYFLNLYVIPLLGTIRITFWEVSFEEFQDGLRGGHLGCRNESPCLPNASHQASA